MRESRYSVFTLLTERALHVFLVRLRIRLPHRRTEHALVKYRQVPATRSASPNTSLHLVPITGSSCPPLADLQCSLCSSSLPSALHIDSSRSRSIAFSAIDLNTFPSLDRTSGFYVLYDISIVDATFFPSLNLSLLYSSVPSRTLLLYYAIVRIGPRHCLAHSYYERSDGGSCGLGSVHLLVLAVTVELVR